jgi:transcription initiation factor TFIID subunit 2
LYGAPAALKWVSDFLQVEQSPGLRLFAVQVCLNCFRGFPPSVSTEILSTIEHGYILSIRRTIQMRDPLCFLQKNPEKKHIQELFACPSLKKLRSDTQMAKIIVEEIWKKMNTCTAFDQRLRIALMVLYKKIWKESTPIAVAHTVQKKSSNWAGGYESLRLMMEESKLRMNNGGTTTTTTTTTSSSSNHQQGYRSTTGTSGSISSLVTKKEATLNVSTTGNGSSSTNSNVTTPTNIGETTALEKLKGKKIKLKMGGDTLFKSHKI